MLQMRGIFSLYVGNRKQWFKWMFDAHGLFVVRGILRKRVYCVRLSLKNHVKIMEAHFGFRENDRKNERRIFM